MCVPFRVERSSQHQTENPNYLLNMYLSDYPNGVDSFIPIPIINSVVARITSGINALIDRRLIRITRAVSDVTIADVNAGSDFAICNTILRVLPGFIMCERLIYVVPLDSQKFQVRLHKKITHSSLELIASDLAAIDENSLRNLVNLAERELGSCAKHTDMPDTAICSETTARRYLSDSSILTESSVLIGKVHNRTDPDRPRGYIMLFNKLNELALMKNSSSTIADEFDWVDATYLSHICSILDFIAELFTAEESRLQRVHVLAHEMHAPTGFIYSTAERLMNSLSGGKQMPDSMKKAELNDILATNDLQSALIDSLMMGMQTGTLPPRLRYNPQRVHLRTIADNVARIAYPICRRYKVPQKNITMRQFPELFIDRRAITQIFLNLLTNAIKYSKENCPNEFYVNVFSEEVGSEELAATNAPISFLDCLKKADIRSGYLLTFQDAGIGIPLFFRKKIFRPGARADIAAVQERTGAGLGLSVVRNIMRDHFGEIWVETFSEPTTFHLFFPDILVSNAYCEREQWRNGGR